VDQNIKLNEPLVSVDWLNDHLEALNLVILDATMDKVVDPSSSASNDIQIPKARFFDIKNKFSDTSNPFPNAVPKEDQFTKEAQKLGINKDSAIVVYDDNGIYSSARAWWLFRAFGHNNVAVLNGGLPEWVNANYEVEPKKPSKGSKGNFKGEYNSQFFKFFDDIIKANDDKKHMILDARSADRFYGRVKEPREGLRSGQIPNSKSLPYTELIFGNKLKPVDDLASIFNNFNGAEKNLVFSCGSGITACVLALGADIAGFKKLSVYDGSWTEYGSLTKE
jgi:thiosulfate/3-mercaptopyruvate sulfurtransferase